MVISDYKIGDEKHILNLFNTTFGKPLSESYWKWRFIDNPEKKIMIKLMWDNDLLVGHYAVSPTTIMVNEQCISAALSMTTMTHPNYIGQKIFTKLAEQLYQDEAIKNNLKVILGFPNNNSHYGFIKNLAWKDLLQIPTFSISLDTIKPHNNKTITKVKTFTQHHINTQKEYLSSNTKHFLKSIEYLNWRYIQNPINFYDIFELKIKEKSFYAVTKLFCTNREKELYDVDIVELVFPEDFESLISLINEIKINYSKYNLCNIHTWIPINSAIHIQLEKIGFTNSLPITYFGIRVLDSNYKDLENSNMWHYSMGDSDIY